MRLLVFGSSGQVAREIARLPVEATLLGRREADLADPERAAQAVARLSPDAVINAAAWTDVDGAEANQDLALTINGTAPGAIARACATAGIPLVHISSDYVFDGSGARPWQPDDAVNPIGAYGASKAAGEAGITAAGGAHAILRTSWVFSAHGHNFVKTMLRLAATRDRLTIVTDQIGGPTPAADLAQACVVVAEALIHNPAQSGTYHFAGAPDTSWAGFAQAIFELSGRDIAVEGIPSSAYPTPARRPLNSRMDCSATETAFGLARPDWRAGLGAVLSELGALA